MRQTIASLTLLTLVVSALSACQPPPADPVDLASTPAPASTVVATPRTPAVSVPPDAQAAVVTWIVDGDTIDVEVLEEGLIPPGEQRIRLLEIDTPERGEDCYETATGLLAELIPVGTEVLLQRDTENLDPNDRYLRYVWSEREGLVNVDMVAEGMAEAFIFPLNRLHEPEILAAEAEARAAGLGIWGPYCEGRP